MGSTNNITFNWNFCKNNLFSMIVSLWCYHHLDFETEKLTHCRYILWLQLLIYDFQMHFIEHWMVVMREVIIWTNTDQALWSYVVLLGHNAI